MNAPPRYHGIIAHYEECLKIHGDTHLGVDWPNPEDADTRYRVMLDLIHRPLAREPVRLLDFGCGASHLYDYIEHERVDGLSYSGLDLSADFIELSRAKFPSNDYWCLDLLTADHGHLGRFDYAVMNGVFTEKMDLQFDEMFDFLTRTVVATFSLVDVGIAFNVMSSCVDWERDDLFHLPFDTLAAWLTRNIGRNFVFRNDYGLYEYTTYVYR